MTRPSCPHAKNTWRNRAKPRKCLKEEKKDDGEGRRWRGPRLGGKLKKNEKKEAGSRKVGKPSPLEKEGEKEQENLKIRGMQSCSNQIHREKLTEKVFFPFPFQPAGLSTP